MLQATGTLDPANIRQIIWEQCWNVSVFGKRFKVCARVLREGSKLYFELEIDGRVARLPLAAACYTVFTIYGIEIKLCLSDIEFSNGALKKICLEVEGCVPVLGCTRLLKHCQAFRLADPAMKAATGWDDEVVPDDAFVYPVA